jgi:hypothetical protein
MANVTNNLYSIIGQFDYDNLIAGEKEPIIKKGVTLAAGQGVLNRGTLLGIVTATGLAVMCDSTKTDGSQIPKYILALEQSPTVTTIDTGVAGSTLNVPTVAYQSGIFNSAAITTVTGQDISTFADQLRSVGIYLTNTITNPTNPI